MSDNKNSIDRLVEGTQPQTLMDPLAELTARFNEKVERAKIAGSATHFPQGIGGTSYDQMIEMRIRVWVARMEKDAAEERLRKLSPQKPAANGKKGPKT